MANLDDFFKERKPFSMADYEAIPLENREEYVKTTSMPAKKQVSAPLDVVGQFSPKPAAVVPPPADVPVSPRVQELKNMFAPQQVVTETPIARSDLIDANKVRSQADSMMPETGVADWLPALAPLAVEALFGGGKAGGVSYGISSKNLLDGVSERNKRRNSLEDKLMEIEKSRAIASAKSGAGTKGMFQSKNVFDKETGKTYFINYNTGTAAWTYPDGTPVPSQKLRTGFAVVPEEFNRREDYKSDVKRSDADYLGSNTKINPQTGELEVIRDGKSTPIVTGQTPQEFNKKQQGDVKEMVSDFTKSPAYAESVNSLSIAPTVTSLLDAAQRSNNPNSVAGNSVMLTMIRQAQKTGPVSDKDAQSMGGTQQLGESIDRLSQKLVGQGGPLTIRDIQELREISEIYRKRSQTLLSEHYGQSKKSYGKRFGFSEEQMEGQLGSKVHPYLGSAEKSFKSDSLPEGIDFGGAKQYPPKKNPNATVPYSLDGKLFWAEPSNADSIKKAHPNAKRLK